MAMTKFQRLVVGIGALLVALRVFFPSGFKACWKEAGKESASILFELCSPSEYELLLQVFGILVLAATAFVLFPSPDFSSLQNKLRRFFLWEGWPGLSLYLSGGWRRRFRLIGWILVGWFLAGLIVNWIWGAYLLSR